MTPITPYDAGYFLCQITAALGGGKYAFQEAWYTGTGYAQKTAGRFGNASNPGVALSGTFNVNDYALCRPAAGAGGLSWELVPLSASAPTSAWKQPVRLAAPVALPANTYSNGPNNDGVGATLTANANGALPVDGVFVALNDGVLVYNEAAGSHNGIYTVTQTGDSTHPYILTRRGDANTASLLLEAAVAVEEGASNADTVWMGTANAPIVVGTTPLPWVKVGPSSAAFNYGSRSGFALVTGDDTWQRIADDTGIQLGLAGTYLITAVVHGSVQVSGALGSGQFAYLMARIFNADTGNEILNPLNQGCASIVASIQQGEQIGQGSITLTQIAVIPSDNANLGLELSRTKSSGAPSWGICFVGHISAGGSTITSLTGIDAIRLP